MLWGTHLKYLFIMGFCVKLHNPVEFSSYLPFLLSHQKWWRLMLISAYMNPENTQLEQVCWKPELGKSLKNSWRWNKWNYQGRQGTVLFFCKIHNFFQRRLQHCCHHPALSWAAASWWGGGVNPAHFSAGFALSQQNGNSWFGFVNHKVFP